MNRQDEYHLKLAVGSINGRRASDPNRKAAGLLLKELSDRHRAGMMIMTCGRPVELLYRLRFDMPYDVWMLRPLFVEDQTPFEGRLKLGDPVKKLHVDYPR